MKKWKMTVVPDRHKLLEIRDGVRTMHWKRLEDGKLKKSEDGNFLEKA